MESAPLIAETELSEHRIQHNCFIWYYNAYPEFRGTVFHVNNKAKNAIEGAKMKSLGVISGIPDIVLIRNGTCYGIEFKSSTGTLSADQKKIHAKWAENGIAVYIVRSLEQFKAIIEEIHAKG